MSVISNMSEQDLLEFTDRLVAIQRTTEVPEERIRLVNAARAAVRELQSRARSEVRMMAELERRHAETLADLERRRAQAGDVAFLIPQAE